MNAEERRIQEKDQNEKDWLRWGPYLSERQWGTVREDYSEYGNAWDYFTHDTARSRAYRWGEDGIAGICDRYCNICFSVALWNGKDPILKERLFGLSNREGNHGEDVKEHYFYLDNVPSHTYMKYLYKYTQNPYPYNQLVSENARRGLNDLEFELQDTGVMDNQQYFDVYTEYAKDSPDDILIKISVCNRYHEEAEIHLLPTLWMRNHWSFRDMEKRPKISLQSHSEQDSVYLSHEYVGDFTFYFEQADELLFTENETNIERVFGAENDHPFKKDLFHDAVINQDFSKATEKAEGTKFSPYYHLKLAAGETRVICLRLSNKSIKKPFEKFEEIFQKRIEETQQFYRDLAPNLSDEQFAIQKQAFSGLLWSKQYYNYDVEKWLEGDPKQPKPPENRWHGRNSDWLTFRNNDILIMPDKWEYPWFAAWDCAFHCATMANLDTEFAKEQLLLFTKEWYMSSKGNFPAYEWSFDDSNPPIQSWVALYIYYKDKEKTGKGDIYFLKRVFNKLALNFTWWVNKKDYTGKNIFEGGFLGLDNIGIFDRSHGVPDGAILEQVDGTAWMALYCLDMLRMSLEISKEDSAFEDMATKYFGHFIFIAEALNKMDCNNIGIWDKQDGFFYDKLIFDDGSSTPIKVRSIEGMLAMVAAININKKDLDKLPKFKKSFEWFQKHKENKLKFPVIQKSDDSILLSLVPKDRLERMISIMLDENELLSSYGVRSLSKVYENPYQIKIKGHTYSINYEPAEGNSGLFGGNSNWRGPIWFPLNYILVQSLREQYKFFKDSIQVPLPNGSNNKKNLCEVADELTDRLTSIFERDSDGNRPVNGLYKALFQTEFYKDFILFHEYFDGNSGRGVGASHQTGWTALIANLILERNQSNE